MKKSFPPKLWGGKFTPYPGSRSQPLGPVVCTGVVHGVRNRRRPRTGSGKNITLKASNTPVSTVMQQIEEQSGYTFFYNTKDIPLDRNVTLSVANKDIRAALDELFRNTNVSYSIDNKSIILSARGARSRSRPARSPAGSSIRTACPSSAPRS